MLEVNPKPLLEMHPHDASERGILDGDTVRVYNDRGCFESEVILTEAIKPGALNICQGWWPAYFKKGHHNDITHMVLNPAQEAIIETNFSPYDNLVEVKKVE
jgi:molybdopterin-containing oxidoreductase family molybdopterin binding subunit